MRGTYLLVAASPIELASSPLHGDVPNPSLTSSIGFVAQAFHTLPFGFNLGDVTGTQGIGV